MISTTDEQLYKFKTGNSSHMRLSVPTEVLVQKISNIQTKTPHGPILITSNDQFKTLGFTGTGSFDDPYKVKDLSITASSGDLINIRGTTVYFRISNNYLNGLTTASSGISLSNVQHGTIENNLIINNTEDGLKATDISETIFHNNSIYSNGRIGMFLYRATNCTLTSNTVHDNLVNGVHLKDAYNATISNNNIYNHQYGEYSHSSILLDNTSSTLITNNSLFNNDYGINILNSANNNRITNNTIHNNQQYGIRLEYTSRNTIIHNNVTNNQLYGILVTYGSNDNTILTNSFINNNGGEIQAFDEGTNNGFRYNYWNDWPIQDTNEDSIIDYPYLIDGNINNSDHHPLVEFSFEEIENIGKSPNNSGILLFIMLILTMIGGSTGLGYLIYKKRLWQRYIESGFETEDPFIDFDLEEQIERVKPLYHKLIVGIENLQTSTLPQPAAIPLLESAESKILVEYFPSDIKNDLRSGMKWRTILTLIEIAYQDPSETNPVKLAQSMDIPASTLSKEIKKLKELHYIEFFVSTQVLRDGRYRSYSITKKGFKFLYNLKEILRLTITRIKEKKGAYDV
jgi:parallel beta-helix repeat protein